MGGIVVRMGIEIVSFVSNWFKMVFCREYFNRFKQKCSSQKLICQQLVAESSPIKNLQEVE